MPAGDNTHLDHERVLLAVVLCYLESHVQCAELIFTPGI